MSRDRFRPARPSTLALGPWPFLLRPWPFPIAFGPASARPGRFPSLLNLALPFPPSPIFLFFSTFPSLARSFAHTQTHEQQLADARKVMDKEAETEAKTFAVESDKLQAKQKAALADHIKHQAQELKDFVKTKAAEAKARAKEHDANLKKGLKDMEKVRPVFHSISWLCARPLTTHQTRASARARLQAQKAEKEAAPKTEHGALKDRFKADLATYKKDSETQFAASQERQAAAQLLAFKRQQQAAHHDFELKQLADVRGPALPDAHAHIRVLACTLTPHPPTNLARGRLRLVPQTVSVLQAQKDQNKARRLRNLESETGMLLAQRKERHAILQSQQNETHKTELEQLDLQLKKEDKDLRKRHQVRNAGPLGTSTLGVLSTLRVCLTLPPWPAPPPPPGRDQGTAQADEDDPVVDPARDDRHGQGHEAAAQRHAKAAARVCAQGSGQAAPHRTAARVRG